MKNIILILLLGVSNFVFSQSHPYVISGKLTGVSDSDVVYINYEFAAAPKKDSVNLHHGEFKIKGDIQEPTIAKLILKHHNAHHSTQDDWLTVIIVPGNTNVVARDSIRHGHLSGTQQNEDLQVFSDFHSEFAAKRAALGFEKDSLRRSARLKEIDAEKAKGFYDFAHQHPNSLISLGAIQEYIEIDLNKADKLFNSLSPEIRNNILGRKVGNAIKRKMSLLNGSVAPEIIQKDANGKIVRLSSFRGKYVLLDFWASWCPPCRVDNHDLVIIYAQYHNSGFDILGISLDRPDERNKWLAAIEKDKLVWTNVSDLKYMMSETALEYGVESIPQNYLIDPTGKIIAQGLSMKGLREKLNTILINAH